MNQFTGDKNYVQDTIAYSRIQQELLSCNQGNSVYGKIALLMDSHMQEIDAMAERFGEIVSKRTTEKYYVEQYGTNPVTGAVKRNLTGNQKAYDNETQRRDIGFVKALLTESVIKGGARGIQWWTNEKDKYKNVEMFYAYLLSFLRKDPNSGNMERAMQELHKIKKSFPLSEHDYLKLTEQSIEKYDIWDCVDHIQNMQQSVRENLSYLLYALYVQKYEESQEQKPLLLQYYDQLGYQEMEAKELIRENEETYNTVTGEQHRYLSMARGMVNNLAPSMPNIDVRSIADRTQQMAANDPYRLRKKKRPGDALLRQRKISDLFFEAPQVCIQAGAVAVAQLELDDSGKETTRETAKKWGAEDSDVDLILQEAEKIQKKVQKES